MSTFADSQSFLLECPLPLRDYPHVTIGHGSGGRLSADLVTHLFLPAFDNEVLRARGDGAVIHVAGGRLVLSTDSFVVRPLFFPGGNIGELAVNGTINDLAMCGAQPLHLTAAFILEEGVPLATLNTIAHAMGTAARRAGVSIVAGDTKVVEKGHGDGVFINTTGLGMIPPGVSIAPQHVRPGDAVLVSGTIGDHGIAIMSVREGLEFDAPIQSDTAPLHTLVQALLAVNAEAVHMLRDPTRGGLAAALNEIAQQAQVGIVLDERAIPIRPAVRAACEMLGLDPLYVANEGKLIAIVAREHAEAMLAAMRAHPLGEAAALIGEVTDQHPEIVALRTRIGGTRVVPMPQGELLPRIC
ncbi:MAG: hydrogenase expression/formation protein HypE [Thermoflexales bacterium]|nr:hydrogenase expression/formation protein HypE [Thermoflexales bacterium]MDW8291540.1 hydrogenase expression/formation protein HypE [Anaerolineae bacterium]